MQMLVIVGNSKRPSTCTGQTRTNPVLGKKVAKIGDGMHDDTPFELLLRSIRAHFDDSPGLRLTPRELQWLWNLGASECESAIASLMAAGFLSQANDGTLVQTRSSIASLDRGRVARTPTTIATRDH
jgi:hypothetical protein